MLKQFSTSRAALLGILLAMVAFSYALATCAGSRSIGVAVRSISSNANLAFTNPIISDAIGTDRDLGLAVVGSNFSRACRAIGGSPPYTFVTSNANAASVLQAAALSLAKSGLVSGTLANVAGPVRFGVTVSDSGISSNANSVSDMFRITIDTSGVFKFANGPLLSNAIRGQFYSSEIDLIGGSTPYKPILAANVLVNGVATANKLLSDVGLGVTSSGNIAGVPVVLGKVEFDATCADKNGIGAVGRDGTGNSQHYVINVSDGPLSSSVVASAISVKAGAGTGKDSVKYAGQTTLNPTAVSGLTLQLYIGPYASPVSPAFVNGKATLKAVKGVSAGISASISSKGQLKITTSGETITAALGAQMLVKVVIGSTVVAEDLPFTIKASSKGTTYTYKTGVGLPGGSFIITSVAGKDDTSRTSPGASDAWKVSFIAQPATGGTAQTFSASNADVTIGKFTMSTAVSVSSKGALKSGKAPTKTANIVTKLAMEPVKGKGSLQTSSVLSSKTGIPTGDNPGSASAGGLFFLNISLNNGAGTANSYQGQGTQQIIPAKNGWTSNIK